MNSRPLAISLKLLIIDVYLAIIYWYFLILRRYLRSNSGCKLRSYNLWGRKVLWNGTQSSRHSYSHFLLLMPNRFDIFRSTSSSRVSIFFFEIICFCCSYKNISLFPLSASNLNCVFLLFKFLLVFIFERSSEESIQWIKD